MPKAPTKKKSPPTKRRAPARRQPGKRFQPTAEQREQVLTLAGYGMGVREISKIVTNPESGRPIDIKTLRKHFAVELSTGRVKAQVQVVESLFNLAVGRAKVIRILANGRQEVLQEPVQADKSAAIYWTKSQGGWMEEEKRKAIEIRLKRVKLEEARVDIAKQLIALKGAIDDDVDPREYARQIKEAVDEIMNVTSPPEE